MTPPRETYGVMPVTPSTERMIPRASPVSCIGRVSDARSERMSVTVTSAATDATSRVICRLNPNTTASESIITAVLTAIAVAATCVITFRDELLSCAVRRAMNSGRFMYRQYFILSVFSSQSRNALSACSLMMFMHGIRRSPYSLAISSYMNESSKSMVLASSLVLP